MKIFENQLLKDENPILIHGDVNPEEDEDDPLNRVSLINEFKNDDNPRVLIATPPSLSEAVSLHINEKKERVCSHAIYLDRNFNGAQFMQSMDRIHRIGMREEDDSSFIIPWEESGEKTEKEFKRNQVYYHFFIANNTIDEIIDDSLWQKYQNMNDALDDNWPNTLDYDGNRVIISKNQADNDFNSLYEHLKKFEK
jgi:SNF2 family DNA or RNA helicase